MVDEDAEIVQAFLEESRENLDQLDQDLIALEATPDDTARLAQVFRTIHTIKGTCGFLGYHQLETVTHAGENLLGALRSGDLVLNAAITTTLLRLVDATRATLDRIETTGTEGDVDFGDLAAALTAHLDADAPVAGRAGEVAPPAEEVASHADAAPAPAAAENSLRVDVGVLDKLMDLVGELVQARNQMAEVAGEDEDGPLAVTHRQLRLATGELQEGVMRARLQPIGTVTGKFRRVVRDLALELGKEVRIEIDGEDVGVDKGVNEALAGPLLHLVRNAVDHGIESPEGRTAAGKPAEGCIRIRAYHEGGRVNVEIADDGAGIDRARLVAQAVASGIVSEAAAPSLSEAEIFDLMFQPGLSTKREVTSISGRGVGLDVVRASLEPFGGTVEVTSEFGHGCVFHISVPLTLAIMPALTTWCAGERYTIPRVDVEEVLHLDATDVQSDVHRIEGATVHRLRRRLLPLVDLPAQLGGRPALERPELTIAVVSSGGKRFGLAVDAMGDMTEAVVKPLPSSVRSVPVFVGVTILGDGLPSLILDIAGIATLAGIVSGTGEGGPDTDADQLGEMNLAGGDDLLVAIGVDGAPLAVRLDSVRRLEQFDSATIERNGAHDVVQYRDTILPLLYWGAANADRPPAGSRTERVHAVVCESSIGLIGLVVERIEEIVAEPALPSQPPTRPGVVASLVLEDRVTELVDIEALVHAAYPTAS